MSRWREGATYRYLGRDEIVCARRYFDGALEMVDLRYAAPVAAAPDGSAVEPEVFTRTARTLAPCVVPRVIDTLGGVCRPDACDHRYGGEPLLADAGPHAGRLCCRSCGGPLWAER